MWVLTTTAEDDMYKGAQEGEEMKKIPFIGND
jgi:hypothetical protein